MDIMCYQYAEERVHPEFWKCLVAKLTISHEGMMMFITDASMLQRLVFSQEGELDHDQIEYVHTISCEVYGQLFL